MTAMDLTDREVELIRRVRLTPEARRAEDIATIIAEQQVVLDSLEPEDKAAYQAQLDAAAAMTPDERRAAILIKRQEMIQLQQSNIDAELVANPTLVGIVSSRSTLVKG